MRKSQNHKLWTTALGLCLLWILTPPAIYSQTVALKLRNGDRLTGNIISENTNGVTLSNTWAKAVLIPLSEILLRETNSVPLLTTNLVVAPPAPATNLTAIATNTPVIATNATVIAKSPPIAPPKPVQKPKEPASWHGDIQVGMDVGLSETRRQLYYAKAKITFAPLPRAGSTNSNRIIERFRNVFDYNASYGTVTTETSDGGSETKLSANRMDGSSKTDFDLGKGRKFFAYNLVGAGYDEIRKIDFRYEVGPGIGYHILARSNLVLNAEFGMNYQVQYLMDSPVTERFYYRFAEDFTWKFSKTLTFDEKLEFFPQVNLVDYRIRFESNLRYWLRENISLNVTVLDLYDTQPAPNVGRNDLQIRSSIGVKF